MNPFLILALLVPSLCFQLTTSEGNLEATNHRFIDLVLNERYGGVVFYGSAENLGFSLADGGTQINNRTVIIGAREAKKTYVINYPESDLPAAYNLDSLNPNRSLVITARDNGEVLPNSIHIIRKSLMGWIPSMLLGGWQTTTGSAYTIRGEAMKAGTFSLNSLTN